MNQLRQSPLFAGLTSDQMDRVLALGVQVAFTAGDTVLKLDCNDHDLYIVLEGRANAVTWDSDKLMELGPGSAFGLLSFVDGRPQPSHIVAIGLMECVRFPAAPLRSLMNSDRDLGFILLATLTRLIAHRYRMAISQLDELFDEVGDVWEHAL